MKTDVFLGALSCIALSSSPFAQLAGPPPPPPERPPSISDSGPTFDDEDTETNIDIPLFSGSSTDPYRRVESGFMNEDLVQDVTVLRLSTPLLFIDPDYYTAVLAYPTVANDIAVIAGTGSRGQDELIVVNSTGLVAWTRDSVNEVFTSRIIDNTSSWQDATMVRSVQFDGLLGTDIIGLSNDRMTLLSYMHAGGTNFLPGPTHTFDMTIHDFVVYDHSGDGLMDIALITDAGLHIFDNSAALVHFEPKHGASNGKIAKISQPNFTHDRLAWADRDINDLKDEIYILGPLGVEESVLIGDLGVVGLVSGDSNGGDYDDLLISHTTDYSVLVLYNLRAVGPTDPSFELSYQGSQSIQFGGGLSASNNEAIPALVDLDNDGDNDVAYPILDTTTLELAKNRVNNEFSMTPHYKAAQVDFHDGFPYYKLHIHYAMSAMPPVGATHIEVQIWKKSHIPTRTNKAAYEALFIPITPQTRFYEAVMTFPESDWSFDSIYFFWARFATFENTNERTEVWPASIYGFTPHTAELGQQPGPSYQWLLDLNGSGAPQGAVDIQAGPGDASVSIGTVVKELEVPDFEDDKEPKEKEKTH